MLVWWAVPWYIALVTRSDYLIAAVLIIIFIVVPTIESIIGG